MLGSEAGTSCARSVAKEIIIPIKNAVFDIGYGNCYECVEGEIYHINTKARKTLKRDADGR